MHSHVLSGLRIRFSSIRPQGDALHLYMLH